MSSVGRAASRGSKTGKGDPNKAHKPDTKTETAKTVDNPKAQPTPEQMRIAQIIENRPMDDPALKEKIKQVMDATHKSEEEACTALHDCDNDLDRAVNMLIEGGAMGEWEVSEKKKKKNRQPPSTTKPEPTSTRSPAAAEAEETWEEEPQAKSVAPVETQQRTRNRGGGGGGPPRMRGRGSQDNRGWRGRENKENERNLEESRGSGAPSGSGGPGEREPRDRDNFRRGTGGSRGGRMSNGPGRGGGRGGRSGPRTFQSRGGQDRSSSFPRSTIETWNPETDGAENKSNSFAPTDDWEIEEYTGDTKVFTASTTGGDGSDTITSLTINNSSSDSSHSATVVNSNIMDFPQNTIVNEPLTQSQTDFLRQFQDNKLSSSGGLSGLGSLTNSTDQKTRGMAPSTATSQAPSNTYNSYAASAAVSTSYSTPYSSSVPVASGTETGYPASSVNSSYSGYQTGQNQAAAYGGTATSYSNAYGSQAVSYANQDGSVQSNTAQPLPARTKTQRPRVPPPSKIPQSAVEMPGDSINNIGLLDVQFGAMDFGSDAFDSSSLEPQQSPHSQQSSQSQQAAMAKYPTAPTGLDTGSVSSSQGGIDLDPFTTAGQKAAVLSQTLKSQQSQAPVQQSQSSVHAPQQAQTNDLKSQPSSYSQQSRGPSSVNVGGGVGVPLDSLVKNDSGASSTSGTVSNASSAPSGAMAYSAPSSNYQSSYQTQKTASGYQSSNTYNSGYSSSQPSSANYPNNSMSGTNSNSANAYQGVAGGYAGSQTYQNVSGVQSVYGGNATGSSGSALVGANSGYTTSSSGTPYQNSYGTSTASATNAKLASGLASAKEAQYDTTATSASNLNSSMTSNSSSGAPGLSNVSSVNNSQALGISGASSLSNTNNATSTKVTNSTAKSGVVPNIPPGVPPMITGTHQYIMSQGGLPYFQQPVYSYEDQQLLPLRIPHMTAPGYYDVFQQAPTSLATGREGSLANVPYSMSDGRFARTDNASPVPSSLSQQNASQAHQQPMMNATGFPPGYAYYYSSSVLPGNYQYGTPAIYPQVAPATNAHGNSSTNQYAKPGNYGYSSGSGYEGLSASQDYSKTGGYAGGHSTAQSGSKAGVAGNTQSTGSSSSDIYSKTHVALGKVNSYDKQGFHSGTPPPFNLAGNQNTGMAPTAGYPPPLFIPPMPHQQHHSTTMMQHPLHQMDMRNTSRRSETGSSSGQRSQSSTQASKAGAKQNYSASYWSGN